MMTEARKQDLIEEFMEEVTSIAKELDDESMPLEDLIQEGYLGLIRGINALDSEDDEETASGGLSVSELLTNAIRLAMDDALESHEEQIQSDDRLVVQVELLNRSIERLTEELGTKPNIDEIANDMKVSQDTVLDILKLTGEDLPDDALRPPGK